jgi:hypothetical protein
MFGPSNPLRLEAPQILEPNYMPIGKLGRMSSVSQVVNPARR